MLGDVEETAVDVVVPFEGLAVVGAPKGADAHSERVFEEPHVVRFIAHEKRSTLMSCVDLTPGESSL